MTRYIKINIIETVRRHDDTFCSTIHKSRRDKRLSQIYPNYNVEEICKPP